MELRSKGIMLHAGRLFPNPGKMFSVFSNPRNSTTPSLPYSNTPSGKAGLTLVEVMLAIAILGIGAGVLLTATSRCMAVATRAQHYSRAQRLMLRVEAENPISRGRDEIDTGTDSGTFENGYKWEREITESDAEGREGLYTVRTRVSWSSRGNESFEEIQQYLYIRPDDEELRSRRGY